MKAKAVRLVLDPKNIPLQPKGVIHVAWWLALSQGVWGGPWGLWVALWGIYALLAGAAFVGMKKQTEVDITKLLDREG